MWRGEAWRVFCLNHAECRCPLCFMGWVKYEPTWVIHSGVVPYYIDVDDDGADDDMMLVIMVAMVWATGIGGRKMGFLSLSGMIMSITNHFSLAMHTGLPLWKSVRV